MKKENQEEKNESVKTEPASETADTQEVAEKKVTKKPRKTTKKTDETSEAENTAETEKVEEGQVPPSPYPYAGQVPPAPYPYMYGQPLPNGYPYMPNGQIPVAPVQTADANQPKTKKNIFGLISFIGYFVVVPLILFFYIEEIMVLALFSFGLLIASLVLSIIGFVKKNNYTKKDMAVASFALNVNIVSIFLLIILFAFTSS